MVENWISWAEEVGNKMRGLRLLLGLMVLLLALNLVAAVVPSSTTPAQENSTEVSYDFSLPGSISLCHEPVPLENRRVLEMLDREFTISVWDRGQVVLWLKRAGRYFPYIEKKLADAGMPADLKFVPVAESALLINVRSSKRAAGLWQFMARTGRRYGLRKNRVIDDRIDFERSTEAALKYLKKLHSIFGNWTLALAAYNCGDAFLLKEIKKQMVKDFYRLHLPPETERFIFRIAAAKIIMENPECYGFHLPPGYVYRPMWYDTTPISIPHRLKLTVLAHALGTDFKVLKEFNPQLRGDHLPQGNHTIKVPPGFGSKVATVLRELGNRERRRQEEISGNRYLVREGDTLGHIAERTGISISTLRRLNGIQGSTIWAGQKLRLVP
jgi:LysM repeat protein